MSIHYLEVVSPDVEALCQSYEASLDLRFSDPVPELGNARTAPLDDGTLLGVRAPMHDAEASVSRPYLLVADIHAAVASAESAGAQVALPPTEIPGRGQCAIYFLGDVQHGLWQI